MVGKVQIHSSTMKRWVSGCFQGIKWVSFSVPGILKVGMVSYGGTFRAEGTEENDTLNILPTPFYLSYTIYLSK